MKDMYVAHYAVDNEYEFFNTFKKAEKYLKERYADCDAGFSEETSDGKDFIAKVTHRSRFDVKQDKEKDGYEWSEEGQGYFIDGNPDNEEWASEFDKVGEILLVEV
ncbi:MAG: hypothetical protein KAJ18_08610 [Candidatus Omnitrophica bacterium]|nr:hypothetical protein [Candidatus Omnitrophota bacterium]